MSGQCSALMRVAVTLCVTPMKPRVVPLQQCVRVASSLPRGDAFELSSNRTDLGRMFEKQPLITVVSTHLLSLAYGAVNH